MRTFATAATSLNAFGFGQGDRIAIVLAPGAISAACILAVSACAAAVPLNPQYTGEEFDDYLRQVAPSALIVRAGDATPARGAAGRLGIPVTDDRNVQTVNEQGLRHERNSVGAGADETSPYFRFSRFFKQFIIDHEIVLVLSSIPVVFDHPIAQTFFFANSKNFLDNSCASRY